MTPLAGLLGDIRAASVFHYDAHDSAGNRMDTAKVIPSPAGGYLAVYHSDEVCHLATSATSANLMTWTHRVVVDEPATQPTIAWTRDGGLLTAAEFNDGHGGRLRVRHWANLEGLLAGRPPASSSPPGPSAPATRAPRASSRPTSTPALASPGSSSASTTTATAGSTGRPAAPSAGSGHGLPPGTRSWTPPSSGPSPRSASRSVATSATGTTCTTAARTTTWSRRRDAGATSPPGGSTSTTGRPGRRTAGGRDPRGQYGVRQPDRDHVARPGGPRCAHGDPVRPHGGGPLARPARCSTWSRSMKARRAENR
jgi:hypothetical protein